jgi:hypothetical protein
MMSCLLWLICINRGNSYFTKRSISDCHSHMILFIFLAVLFAFCSLTSYIIFGASHYFDFGVYFAALCIYSLFMVLALFTIKYKVRKSTL